MRKNFRQRGVGTTTTGALHQRAPQRNIQDFRRLIKVRILLEETVRRSEITGVGSVDELKVRDALLTVVERHARGRRRVCQEPRGVLVGAALCALGNAGREEGRLAALQLAPDVVVQRSHPQALRGASCVAVRQAGGIGNDFAFASNALFRTTNIGVTAHGTTVRQTGRHNTRVPRKRVARRAFIHGDDATTGWCRVDAVLRIKQPLPSATRPGGEVIAGLQKNAVDRQTSGATHDGWWRRKRASRTIDIEAIDQVRDALTSLAIERWIQFILKAIDHRPTWCSTV